jgi:hypothetical protein
VESGQPAARYLLIVATIAKLFDVHPPIPFQQLTPLTNGAKLKVLPNMTASSSSTHADTFC